MFGSLLRASVSSVLGCAFTWSRISLLLSATALPLFGSVGIAASGATNASTYSLAGSAYTQSFDTLPTASFTWANDSTLPGWYAITSAGSVNTSAVVSDGSSNLADLVIASVGTSGVAERALTYHTRVSTTTTYLGLQFVNNSGRELTAFDLAYVAEQWKEGTNQRTLTCTVQYRVGASAGDLSAASGWTTLPTLTHTTLNGAAGASTPRAVTSVAASVPAGGSIWFRWAISNDAATSTSSHDTLAIDNVSVAFTAAADGSPTITTQPQSQSVNLGSGAATSVTFTVAAAGDAPLSYQWKKGGNDLSGATAASFTIAEVQELDAGDYTVTVSNAKGSVTSSTATLTVTNTVVAPAIATQPASLTVDAGGTATFTVVATGGAPLSYQWRKNGQALSGALADTLTLANVSATDAGDYTVVVSNSAGSVTSAAATLSLTGVVTPPTILEQSGSQSVVVGGAVAFTVTAGGSAPFTYQWSKNNTPISGATSRALALSNVTNADAGDYTVTVTNDGGSATSAPATLTVTEPPVGSDAALFVAPDGSADNPGTYAQPTTLANAIALVPAGGTIYVRGGTYASSVQLTIARGNNGSAGLTKRIFAYTPPGGAMEKPLLDFSSQPYGSTSSVSNPRGIFVGGDYWHLKGLEVKGSADNGIFVAGNHNVVELCVTQKNRDSGLQIARYSSSAPQSEWPSYNLILNCESYDNYDSAPNGGENADGFACKLTSGPGNVFRGCVSHHNIDDGWDLYTKSATGPIDPVVIDQCVAHHNGTLTDGTQNPAGDRNGFKLGGEKIAVAHYVSRSISFANGKNGFTWNSNPGAIQLVNCLAFDNTEGNFKFDSGDAKFYNNVSLYTASTGAGNRVGISDRYAAASGAATGATNVFWYTGSSSRGPSINDSSLSAYASGFVTLTAPANGFARAADGGLALGDFGRPVSGSALLNAGALPPTDVVAWLPYDTATAYEGAPDLGAVETFLQSPPAVVSPPQSQSVLVGAGVTFSVSVQGTAPFSYQWKKGDAALDGATAASLTLASAQLADAGSYTVTITNAFGSITSAAATLAVSNPQTPTITTQPQAQTVTEGDAVQFAVVATGSAPLSYQWRKGGNALAGATSATYAIAAAALGDAGDYSVVVSNSYGDVTSATATLTVNAAPAAPVAADASAVAPTSFTAAWSSVAGATSYRLDVSARSDFTTFLTAYQNLDVGADLSRAVTGLASGTAYYYRVRAVHATGTSLSSNIVSVLTSGAATTAVDVSALTWFKSRTADSVATNTGAKSVTFTEAQTSSSMFVTHLPSAVTIAVGQKLTLSFTLQTGATLPTTTNALRIGLFNTNGTAIAANTSGDSSTSFVNDAGYMVSYSLNAGTGTLYGRTPSSGSANEQQLMGTTGEYAALASPAATGTAAAFAASTSYAVALTITRNTGTTDVSLQLDGGATANYTLSATDSASGSLGTASFDEFAIRVAGGSNSISGFTLSDLAHSVEAAGPSAPAISTQPASQSAPLGGDATFTVVASGTAPLTYQWRKNGENLADATAATLTLAGVTANDAGDYTVVVTNSVGSVTSAVATLTTFAPIAPSITTPPQSQSATLGGSVTFSVAAGGTAPLSYRWQKNGADVAGATASNYTLTSLQASDAADYRVVVTNLAGSATSDVATLTLVAPQPPTIAAQPQSQTVNDGGSVTFSVTASGTAPFSYQWKKDDADLAGATSATLSLTGVTLASAGSYTVVVTNAGGSATSAAATLTVQAIAPTIATQPAAQSAALGGSATFRVVANGTAPLSYQWQKNETDISGATSSSFTIAGVQNSDFASYRVVVSNRAGSVTSAAAALSLASGLPKTAFNLTGWATVGSGTTGGGIVAETDPAYRKVGTPQEFVQAVIDANKTAGAVKVIEITADLSLGWNEVGTAVQNLASNALRAHATPKLHPVLLVTGVGILDIKAKSGLTIFSAHGATIRHCNFNVKGTSNIVIRNLKFDELWEWDEASKGDYDSNDWDFITLGNGGAVSNIWIDHCTFTKAYDGIVDMKAGTSNVTLSWCRYVGDDGATNANSWVRQQLAALEANKSAYTGYKFLRDTAGFTLDEIATISQGHDKCHLMGANSLKSENATLSATFHHQWLRNLWDRVVPRLRGGNVHNYNLYVDDTVALQARRMRDAKAATTLTASQLTSFNNGSPYKLRPFLNGTISTEGGAILVEKSIYSDCITPLRNNQTDPSDSAYTGKVLALDTIYRFNNADGSFTEVRGNSTDADSPLGPFQATIVPFAWTLAENQLPYATPPMDDPANLPAILEAGAGAGVLTWTKDNWLRTAYVADTPAAPTITTQPQAKTAVAGAAVTFSVAATGEGTLAYQWRKGGAPIAGANSASYPIAAVTASDAGSYDVVVTNAGGDTTSATVTLTLATGFDAWLLQNFSADEQANTAVSGPNASALGDGISNLTKYALGVGPRDQLPAEWQRIESVSGAWVYTYRRPASRADLGYAVEVSSDLANWTTSGVLHELEATADGVETWHAIYVPPTDKPNAFFRLRITR